MLKAEQTKKKQQSNAQTEDYTHHSDADPLAAKTGELHISKHEDRISTDESIAEIQTPPTRIPSSISNAEESSAGDLDVADNLDGVQSVMEEIPLQIDSNRTPESNAADAVKNNVIFTPNSSNFSKSNGLSLPAEIKSFPKTVSPSFSAEFSKKLHSFSQASEWSDFISILGSLEDILNKYSVDYICCVPILVKRLNQCLDDSLPAGVHIRAIGLYMKVIEKISKGLIVLKTNKDAPTEDGDDTGVDGKTAISVDRLEYVRSIFPLLTIGIYDFSLSCRMLVVEEYIDLIEYYIIPLFKKLNAGGYSANGNNPITNSNNMAEGIFLSLLPTLENESNDSYDRSYRLLSGLVDAYDDIEGYNMLWRLFIKYPGIRTSVIQFMNKHNRIKEIVGRVVGIDDAYAVAVYNAAFMVGLTSDSSFLIRNILEYTSGLCRMPNTHYEFIKEVKMVVLKVLLRKEASLNRRVFKWFDKESNIKDAICDYISNDGGATASTVSSKALEENLNSFFKISLLLPELYHGCVIKGIVLLSEFHSGELYSNTLKLARICLNRNMDVFVELFYKELATGSNSAVVTKAIVFSIQNLSLSIGQSILKYSKAIVEGYYGKLIDIGLAKEYFSTVDSSSEDILACILDTEYSDHRLQLIEYYIQDNEVDVSSRYLDNLKEYLTTHYEYTYLVEVLGLASNGTHTYSLFENIWMDYCRTGSMEYILHYNIEDYLIHLYSKELGSGDVASDGEYSSENGSDDPLISLLSTSINLNKYHSLFLFCRLIYPMEYSILVQGIREIGIIETIVGCLASQDAISGKEAVWTANSEVSSSIARYNSLVCSNLSLLHALYDLLQNNLLMEYCEKEELVREAIIRMLDDIANTSNANASHKAIALASLRILSVISTSNTHIVKSICRIWPDPILAQYSLLLLRDEVDFVIAVYSKYYPLIFNTMGNEFIEEYIKRIVVKIIPDSICGVYADGGKCISNAASFLFLNSLIGSYKYLTTSFKHYKDYYRAALRSIVDHNVVDQATCNFTHKLWMSNHSLFTKEMVVYIKARDIANIHHFATWLPNCHFYPELFGKLIPELSSKAILSMLIAMSTSNGSLVSNMVDTSFTLLKNRLAYSSLSEDDILLSIYVNTIQSDKSMINNILLNIEEIINTDRSDASRCMDNADSGLDWVGHLSSLNRMIFFMFPLMLQTPNFINNYRGIIFSRIKDIEILRIIERISILDYTATKEHNPVEECSHDALIASHIHASYADAMLDSSLYPSRIILRNSFMEFIKTYLQKDSFFSPDYSRLLVLYKIFKGMCESGNGPPSTVGHDSDSIRYNPSTHDDTESITFIPLINHFISAVDSAFFYSYSTRLFALKRISFLILTGEYNIITNHYKSSSISVCSSVIVFIHGILSKNPGLELRSAIYTLVRILLLKTEHKSIRHLYPIIIEDMLDTINQIDSDTIADTLIGNMCANNCAKCANNTYANGKCTNTTCTNNCSDPNSIAARCYGCLESIFKNEAIQSSATNLLAVISIIDISEFLKSKIFNFRCILDHLRKKLQINASRCSTHRINSRPSVVSPRLFFRFYSLKFTKYYLENVDLYYSQFVDARNDQRDYEDAELCILREMSK